MDDDGPPAGPPSPGRLAFLAVLVSATLLGGASDAGTLRAGQAETSESATLRVPGGAAFLRALAGMPPPSSGSLGPDSLPVQLAEFLEPPRMAPVAERLIEALEELRALRDELASLQERGAGTPRLGAAGDARARAILEALGLRPVPEAMPERLEPGEDATRRRELLGHLGIDLEERARAWLAGEPVEVSIPDVDVALPEPFPAWERIFGEPVPAARRLVRLLEDDRGRAVVLALGRLDRPTRVAVLRAPDEGLLRRHAHRLAALAPYLRGDESRGLRVPGEATDAWAAILDTDDDTVAGLLAALLDAPTALRHLWRALALIPAERARYLLTLAHENPAARAAWARRLAASVRAPERTEGLRWPADPAELFAHLDLRTAPSSHPGAAAAGVEPAGIDWPGGAGAWLAALEARTPPADRAALEVARAADRDGPRDGPDADAEILEALLRGADPERPRASTIAGYLAVASALRYQNRAVAAEAVPLLFPAWPRIGHAYGFLAVPAPLEPETVVAFGLHALGVHGLEGAPRTAASRQLQATLILTRRLVDNGLLEAIDRPGVLQSLFALPVQPRSAHPAGGPPTVAGYGPGLAQWYRERLLPAAARALQRRGWQGAPDDLREVLFAAAVGNAGGTTLRVDGIDYRYNAVVDLGDRMARHLVEQHVPVLDRLLGLDALAAAAGEPGTDRIGLADRLEELLAAVRRSVPEDAASGTLEADHPVPVPRSALFERGAELVAGLRRGTVEDGAPEILRWAVASWMGDALAGLAYGLQLGPGQVGDHRHLVWPHRMDPQGNDSDLVDPWLPTAVAWDPAEGEVLRNGLMGVPEHAGRWRLQDAAVAAGGARLDPAVEQAWGATLGQIHVPSLDDDTQAAVARLHRTGLDWVREAVRRREPGLPPPAGRDAAPATEGNGAAGVHLFETLRMLLPPPAAEEIADAVRAGSERGALRRLSPGTAFTLGLRATGAPADPGGRWRLDQAAGMAVGRPGDGLGLAVPAPTRYGEAADGDPALYNRLLDVRVALALAMEERALPATLHERLLAEAMAATLGDVRSAGAAPWRRLLAAIPGAVDAGAVGDWTVDLAFSDELEPTDSADARETRQRRRDAMLGGAWRPAGLGLPGAADDGQSPLFRTTVDLVTVDVGVWADDRFVADLEAGDFTVEVEGRAVRPSFARLEGNPEATVVEVPLPAPVAERVVPAGRNLVVIADLQATPGPPWRQVLDDLLALVGGLADRDRVAVIEIDTSGRPRLRLGFTRDHRAAARALEELQPPGPGTAVAGAQRAVTELPRTLCDNAGCDCRNQDLCSTALTPAFNGCVTRCDTLEARKLSAARALGRSFAFDELTRAQNQIDVLRAIAETLEAGDPDNRTKTLVLLSPGFEVQVGASIEQLLSEYRTAVEDVIPGIRLGLPDTGVDDLRPELGELVAALHRCRCTLYSVDTRGPDRGLVDASIRADVGAATEIVRRGLQDALTALALDTGGRPFLDSSNFERAFARILDESRLRYVLAIPLADLGLDPEADDPWRRIDVQVTRPDVQVRAPEGFFWPTPTER